MPIHGPKNFKQNLQNKLTIIVLGRSGSGKGTQAGFIVRRLKKEGVSHFETGRFLREEIKKNNPTIDLARKIMRRGELFPSWLSAHTWLKRIIDQGAAINHWVFDGAPRRIWEAKLIDEVTRWHGRSLPFCVYIEVGEKEAARRLLGRGRGDDRLRSIHNRMRFFDREVLPVVRYYKKEGRLISVNGQDTREEVWSDIDKALWKRFGTGWPKS